MPHGSMTRDLKRLLRKKKRLYDDCKRSNNPGDKQKYRQFQKHLNRKLRKAQDDFIAATLDIEPNDKPKNEEWMRKLKLIYSFMISARPLTRYPTRDYSQN